MRARLLYFRDAGQVRSKGGRQNRWQAHQWEKRLAGRVGKSPETDYKGSAMLKKNSELIINPKKPFENDALDREPAIQLSPQLHK
jgi:hypothetical protein